MMQSWPSYAQGFARNAAEAANPNLWRDLVGAWLPSLGPTGNVLQDWSGHGNHGTLTGMAPATDWVIDSDRGYVLNFDGSGHVVGTSDPLANASIVSAACWVKAGRDENYDGWIGTKGAFNGDGFVIWTVGSNYEAKIDGGKADIGPIDAGVWHHVGFSYDGTFLRVFYDGAFVSSTNVGVENVPNRALWIGQSYGGYYAVGQVGDVLLADTVWADNIFTQLYEDPHALVREKRFRVVKAPVAAATYRAGKVERRVSIPSYAQGFARSASESANPGLWDGLVHAWAPLGATGETWRDQAGYGCHGVLTGMNPDVDWVLMPNVGYGLDFDGSDDRAILPDSTALNGSSAMTVVLLLKPTTINFPSAKACYARGATGNRGPWINGRNGLATVLCQLETDGTAGKGNAESPALTAGIWQQVAFRFGGGTHTGYVNLQPGTPNAGAGSAIASDGASHVIGRNASGNNWLGGIGYVYVWNRCISLNELEMIYRNPLVMFELGESVVAVKAAASSFVPYPYPRHSMTGGLAV